MNRKSLFLLALIVPFAPTGAAAPDTPPSLTWEVPLTEPQELGSGAQGPCNQFLDEKTRIVSVRVGKDAHPWTLENCQNVNNFGFVVRRFDPSGTLECSAFFKQADSATNDYTQVPHSIDVDPDNRAWVWYDDQSHAPDPTLTLAVLDRQCQPDVVRSNDQFSSSNSIVTTAFNETGPQTFRAYAGGGLSRIAYECTNLSACTELYEINGDPGAGYVHHGGPYINNLYGFENNAGTFQVHTMHQTTGAILDTETIGSVSALFQPWIHGGDPTRLIVPYGQIDAGDVEPRWLEHNSSTLTNIRDVSSPIEHYPFTYDNFNPQGNFVDGEGNVFFCGQARTPGLKRDVALVKYNNTAFPGQRWNITFSNQPGDSNFDLARTCALSNDGSIYLGGVVCANSDTQCESYLRKYAGGGIGRTPQTVFDGFSEPSTTTPFATGGAIGFKDFCLAVGFEDTAGRFLCGLVIVLTSAGIMAFVLADKKDSGAPRFGKGSVFGGGFTAAGMSIFVTAIELWPLYTLVIMIAAVAFLIGYLVKRQFAGG